MPNVPKLQPDDQFPKQAIAESIQVQPEPEAYSGQFLTLLLASAADYITPWGMNQVRRDQQLRDFWPTESYLLYR